MSGSAVAVRDRSEEVLDMVATRGDALELAVLGLLHDAPLHGYEVRKRVNGLCGWSRVLSYGTLYPCLKSLLRRGLIEPEGTAGTGRRTRIVYRLSAEGKARFVELMTRGGPAAWDDDSFGVHFAFFARTDRATRVRILEGRRSRLEERMAGVRAVLARTAERVDTYTLELQRHGLESVEHDVRWLSELINTERSGAPVARTDPQPSDTPPDTQRT
jgi:DNA-binding PadR family transcriptional regulator